MGQYWTLINLDKKDSTSSFALGSGTKLTEMAWNTGPSASLVILLAVHGGDHVAIGRWAGDRIVLIGDYAEDDDMDRSVWGGDKPNDLKGYVDISDLVHDVLKPEKMKRILADAKSKHWMIYNVSCEEYFSPTILGCGSSLADITYTQPGPPMALHLLAASFPCRRGGGDPCSGHHAIGRWAAGRLATIGAAATMHDMWPGIWDGAAPLDFSRYKDISTDVREMLEAETREDGDSSLKPAVPGTFFPCKPAAAIGPQADLAAATGGSCKDADTGRPSGWAALPEELVLAIANFAHDARDKAALRLISRRWRSGASASVTHLRPSRQLWDEALSHLVRAFPKLEVLDLSGCARITDAGCVALAEACSGLRDLDLSSTCGIVGWGPAFCTGLTALLMNEARHLRGLVALEKLPELRRLELRGVGLNDNGLEQVAQAAAAGQLTSLLFENATFGEPGKDLLCKKFPSLVELSVSGCEKLEDKWLQDFGALKKLKSLELGSCKVTDAGLKALAANLPNLTSLDLHRCRDITDEGLHHLAALPSLQSLNLRDCDGLTDAALVVLEGMPNLASVDLKICDKLTDQAVARLKEAAPWLQKVEFGAEAEKEIGCCIQ